MYQFSNTAFKPIITVRNCVHIFRECQPITASHREIIFLIRRRILYFFADFFLCNCPIRFLEIENPKRVLQGVVIEIQSADIVVIDEIKLDAIKTKPMASFLKAVGADTKALVVTAENNEVVVKSAANIPGVLVTFANLINVYDILNAKKLVVDKAALAKIEEVFA